MRWIHIDFWFRDYARNDGFTEGEQQQFEDLLRRYLKLIKPFIRRKFYLYENIPHCFLALELRCILFLPFVALIMKIIYRPIFIVKCGYNPTASGDQGNDNGALNIWNAFTDFYLFHRDNKISHIIHCCLEPIFASRKLENEFYQKMAIMYQEVIFKSDKPQFLYKDITPKIREELKQYQKSLDLRKP